MGLKGRRTFAACLLLVSCLWGALDAGQAPLPDEDLFFADVRDNMARANREQHKYAYKERRTELHTNPFGRLGTGDVHLYDVTPGSTPTVTFRKLLEKNGKPVADSKPERQERRLRTSSRSAVEDTVATLRFTIDRRESSGGRTQIVVRFEPRPEAEPETREGKLAKSFKGFIWVDEAQRDVTRVEATAIDDLSYGFGIVARLNKGSVVTLKREQVDEEIWLPTAIRFKGDGRAMLVRRLSIDFAIDWFDYRKT